MDIIYRDENCCLITDKGSRENNEDFGAVEKVGEGYLIVVADGLGGHVGGELASKIAVPSFIDYFKHNYGKENIEEVMRKALKFAHEEIIEYKELNPEYGDMGTTLVAAYIKDKVHVVWCGDSRAYLIKDGRIVRRTKDHSPVQRMVDAGEITEEETMRHPMRHIVSNAVGIKLKVDYEEWEPGDYLMLSTDGLHDYLTSKEIEEEFYGGACEVAERLMKKALERSGDNVTVAVLKMSVKDEGRVVREAILKAGEEGDVKEKFESVASLVKGKVRGGIYYTFKNLASSSVLEGEFYKRVWEELRKISMEKEKVDAKDILTVIMKVRDELYPEDVKLLESSPLRLAVSDPLQAVRIIRMKREIVNLIVNPIRAEVEENA